MRPLIDAAATRAASLDPEVSAEKNFGNPGTTGFVHKLFRSVEAASHPWKLNRMKDQAPYPTSLTRDWSVLEAYATVVRKSLHTQGQSRSHLDRRVVRHSNARLKTTERFERDWQGGGLDRLQPKQRDRHSEAAP